MINEIIVPEVSEGVTAGTVVAISVTVGDMVEEDQTLLELETDKAVIAIPAPDNGRITEIKVAEGDSVEIGAVIMSMETSTEAAEPVEEPVVEETPVSVEPEAPEALQPPLEPEEEQEQQTSSPVTANSSAASARW